MTNSMQYRGYEASMSFDVEDEAFFLKALEPLGVVVVAEVPLEYIRHTEV